MRSETVCRPAEREILSTLRDEGYGKYVILRGLRNQAGVKDAKEGVLGRGSQKID